MTALNKQELEIIRVFSSLDVPERIIRDSNIKQLIHDMCDAQESVQSDAKRLENLRQEKKDGNFIGNLWHGRDDKVQDAQIDLNKSIGLLTQKSSQLLIVNTVFSKALRDQQQILLNQQQMLENQTAMLLEQNAKIFQQQKLLEMQQQEINKANQGLLEAKGLTQEQAKKLVGCVVAVTEAETKIGIANQKLRSDLEQCLSVSVAQCVDRLSAGFAEQDQRHITFKHQFTDAFSKQSINAQHELERLAAESAQSKVTLEQHLNAGLVEQGQRHAVFEEHISGASSEQNRYVRASLDQFGNSNAEFQARVEQQLQSHIQTLLDKTESQDAAAQRGQDTILAQLKNLYQEIVLTVDQKNLDLLQTLKAAEIQQFSALQEQAQGLKGQRDALKHTETQLFSLQSEQQRSVIENRRTLAVLMCLLLTSIGWQVLNHFSVF